MRGFILGLSWLAFCASASAQEWRGVDLSYVNELEDCGVVYRNGAGQPVDAFAVFASEGANIVRIRLWHTPNWTRYSTLADVKRTIARSKAAGMRVLLDFHYSDDWAHPGKQLVPTAWKDLGSPEAMAQALYDYTYDTLIELAGAGLTPDFVQVGNETNTNLLITEEIPENAPVDWDRNALFFKAGTKAVRQASADISAPIGIVLHVAQPENVIRWFDGATKAGVTDFDIIGISYYAKWSSTSFSKLTKELEKIKKRYGKDFAVVETAYPWTLEAQDDAGNLLGADSLVDGYPASIDGQRRYLLDLSANVAAAGGLGVVYWEPAWVSSGCQTRWGTGSHWENATLFDFAGPTLHDGAAFLRGNE